MDPTQFNKSLTAKAPPAGLKAPLEALWWEAKGDWTKAHEIAQDHEGDAPSDWVHAYLHRVEGDLGNAGYWYRRAGRAPATDALKAEWEKLVTSFLGAAPP
jgi:hypothetical protein